LSDVRTAVLGASDFRVILSALKQITGVTVVSNPKILVANEEPATIHIGERERPFVSSVTPGQQGIAPVVTYNPGDAVDTGVKLTVTPTVNTESNITVRIEPELTRFVRNAVAPNNQTFPVIATKRIRTVFCLESGKTVAIGGLTDTQDREQSTKIPLLGDIPIIGKYLFSHSRKAKSQQETIIFVTVSLASPSTIHRTSGLPEDTELMRRHILKEEVKKAEARMSLGQAEEAAAAWAAGEDATTSDASTTPSP
jgi:type II secretory pathway component GspD/PulD (secretin)